MVSRCESGASPFTPNDGRAPRGGFFLCLALAVPVSLLAFSFPLALALAFAFPSQSLNPTPFSAAILGGLLTLTDAIDLFVSLTSLNFCGSYFAFRSCVFFSVGSSIHCPFHVFYVGTSRLSGSVKTKMRITGKKDNTKEEKMEITTPLCISEAEGPTRQKVVME